LVDYRFIKYYFAVCKIIVDLHKIYMAFIRENRITKLSLIGIYTT